MQTYYGHQNSCNNVTSDLKVSLPCTHPTLYILAVDKTAWLEPMLLSTGAVCVLMWCTGWCPVLGHTQRCGPRSVLGPVTVCCPQCGCGPSRQPAGLCWGRWPHHHTGHLSPAGEATWCGWPCVMLLPPLQEWTLRGHEECVWSVVFTPSAESLLSSAADGSVIVWS